MGRAVMVGRGPTGAGLPLVLPILIVLAARSCRAQKGWLVNSGLTQLTAATRRSTLPLKVWQCCCFHMSVHCWGKYGALLLSSGKIEGGLPYMAVPRTWSSARFTPLAAAAPSCGHVWRSETGQTGSKSNRESRVSSAPRWGRLLTQLAFWAGERKRKERKKENLPKD